MYLELLRAGANQNKKEAIRLSIELGFLTGMESEQMLSAHVNSLCLLALPFKKSNETFDFQSGNELAALVKQDIPLMLRERLKPPPDETYSLHRKLSGCFLLCAKLGSRIYASKLFEEQYVNYK